MREEELHVLFAVFSLFILNLQGAFDLEVGGGIDIAVVIMLALLSIFEGIILFSLASLAKADHGCLLPGVLILLIVSHLMQEHGTLPNKG